MKALLLGLIFWGAASSADIIKCEFTEPFYGTTYSMVQQSITLEDYFEGETQVFKNVSFQIMGPGHFELWDKDGNVLQTLFLNYEGSDGMSDRIYPYHVINSENFFGAGVSDGMGGCTSNFLFAQDLFGNE